MSTMPSECTFTMKYSQMYATKENDVVTKNTNRSWICRTSPLGIATTTIAEITKRLKAALPTIVDGPSWPAW